MPCSCWVPGCRSNYESDVKSGNARVTVFSFPKEPDRVQAWLSNIKRTDLAPTRHSKICIKHFERRYIVTESSAVRDDGSVLTLQRDRLVLSKDAIPTIFENLSTDNIRSRPGEKRKAKKKGELKVTEEGLCQGEYIACDEKNDEIRDDKTSQVSIFCDQSLSSWFADFDNLFSQVSGTYQISSEKMYIILIKY